ncbi:D-alanyl-D-alanine carboxypeptidase [Rhodovulum sp. 12E13]|uniref:D-alanyl-D-alanine carboxypeptidase family protein n=1 Tax=Rhodovulum sp. 12E13 TaxID=2203891 RepID=UPI000E125878|nr:D-alanyl-D-alanine carboxypeptidase family protein [Rhodovulum sp. 12E13]RDC70954.1 D-alanyl-D-alanine carboxypeptidase [Rhodovulum sp. 12E13]
MQPPRLPSARPVLLLALLLTGLAGAAATAPRATFVMDARTGEVLVAENAEARLHPASLTKMMTLYLAFAAAARGEIDLDAMTTVSATAAAEPGSRLGLRPGQRIALRHLVRAVAVKSANDAATALAEAIAGDEAAFVARMNEAAGAMGLAGTSFANAHGLTEAGHLSTARDMSILARRLRFDFPGEWALFSRLEADAGVRRVAHTNRRFLSGYAGADGVKTGYTSAAGYTLAASAVRGERWVIATVFGEASSAARAAKVSRLMDAAFASIPAETDWVPPPPLGPLLAAARPLLEAWAAEPGPLGGHTGGAGSAGGPAPAGGVSISGLGGPARRPLAWRRRRPCVPRHGPTPHMGAAGGRGDAGARAVLMGATRPEWAARAAPARGRPRPPSRFPVQVPRPGSPSGSRYAWAGSVSRPDFRP